MAEESLFHKYPDIVPSPLGKNLSIEELIQYMGGTAFEARHVFRASKLFQLMIEDNDTNWLGIAGAGIAGGMGGMVISLIENGFIDVICSTGAQVYHDLHFAFGLPVKAIPSLWDDDALRKHGDTRIFDIGIREKETLEAQDALIRKFVSDYRHELTQTEMASWTFNYFLGQWVNKTAPHPERSFTAAAARSHVPVFWDSHTNHSIAMNLLRSEKEGNPVSLSAGKDIRDSAAIVFQAKGTGFLELGGGGPKNFIQQTGPTLSQILGIDFEGADRGIQIGTAIEREGSLSGCTFGEAVTWGKYKQADDDKLIQIWAEYSIVFPLLTAFVINNCKSRTRKNLAQKMPEIIQNLENAQ